MENVLRKFYLQTKMTECDTDLTKTNGLTKIQTDTDLPRVTYSKKQRDRQDADLARLNGQIDRNSIDFDLTMLIIL